MNWRAWWDALRDAFNLPPSKPKPPSEPKRNNGYEPPKPANPFIPPHSHTEEHPVLPKKEDRG